MTAGASLPEAPDGPRAAVEEPPDEADPCALVPARGDDTAAAGRSEAPVPADGLAEAPLPAAGRTAEEPAQLEEPLTPLGGAGGAFQMP